MSCLKLELRIRSDGVVVFEQHQPVRANHLLWIDGQLLMLTRALHRISQPDDC